MISMWFTVDEKNCNLSSQSFKLCIPDLRHSLLTRDMNRIVTSSITHQVLFPLWKMLIRQDPLGNLFYHTRIKRFRRKATQPQPRKGYWISDPYPIAMALYWTILPPHSPRISLVCLRFLNKCLLRNEEFGCLPLRFLWENIWYCMKSTENLYMIPRISRLFWRHLAFTLGTLFE